VRGNGEILSQVVASQVQMPLIGANAFIFVVVAYLALVLNGAWGLRGV